MVTPTDCRQLDLVAISMVQAVEALGAAEDLMEGGDFVVASAEVLETAVSNHCTAYDSEFVVLAHDLGVKLVTLDASILRAFPEIAVSLREYGEPNGAWRSR